MMLGLLTAYEKNKIYVLQYEIARKQNELGKLSEKNRQLLIMTAKLKLPNYLITKANEYNLILTDLNHSVITRASEATTEIAKKQHNVKGIARNNERNYERKR